jgi:signal transduction histidine kinase
MVELRVGGETVFRSAGLGAAKLPEAGDAGSRKVRLSGGTMRRAVFSEGDATLTVFASCAPVEELGRDLLVIFSFGAPVSLGLAALGGRWIARKALEPVREIALSAERISSRDLARRVPVPEAEDDLRRMALVLNETFDRLAASFEQARRFSADASHELRTPLSVIEAHTSLALAHDREAAWYRAAFDRVDREARRMRRLLEDMLWLARFDAAQPPGAREPVDLAVLATQATDRFGAVAEARRLELTVEVPSESVVIHASADLVDRLIGVLLDNACKYAPEGGRVVVSVAVDVGRASVRVGDSGPGIRAEERDRIFDRFHRSVATTGEPGGAGLGLAIGDAIVHATGGRWALAESSLGGASFGVSWPRATLGR